MTEWQPIETAPKDADIQLGGPGWVRHGYWDKYEKVHGAWTSGRVSSWGYEEVELLDPTHWMPLPEPPK